MIYPVPKPKRVRRKKEPTPKEIEAIRRQRFEMDGYRCQHDLKPPIYILGYPNHIYRCLKPVTWETGHLAHVIPRSRGGTWELSNLLTKCQKCHIGIEHSYGPSGVKPVPKKPIDTDTI